MFKIITHYTCTCILEPVFDQRELKKNINLKEG